MINKKSQKGITLIAIIAIILFIIVIGGIIFIIINLSNKEESNVIKIESNVISTDFNEKSDSKLEDDLNSWNGTYQNGNITIQIYRTGENAINIYMIKSSGGFNENGVIQMGDKTHSISVTNLNSSENIEYTTEIFGEEISITIKKVNEGIEIKASSTEADSLLNECDGKYVKKEFESSNWDGLYEKGDMIIILSEYDNNKMCINITEHGKHRYWGTFIEEYTNDEIRYNNNSMGDEEELKITKTNTGIKVEGKSSKESSMLNEINGEFSKS